jgi:DNA repair protein RadC
MSAGDAYRRIQQHGLKAVSTADLMCMILSREERDIEANERAALEIVRRYPGSRLMDLSPAELHSVAGIEGFEGLRLLAAMELGRRVAGQGKQLVESISDQEEAYQVFRWLENETQEHFCAAFLNTKAAILSTKVIHIGTLNMSVVGARELFREAVRENAASVIVAHNHPSGDPTPSPEDVAITKKLAEVGELLDVPVLDHIIVGQGKFVSLHQLGVL